jgi:predicted nucleotidyltransferase
MDNVIDEVTALLRAHEFEWNDVILLAEAGSTMHGVGVGDQDDLDLVVVRVEPFEELVTGSPRDQSVMVRTQPEGKRSGPGDVDLQCYSLRRFAQLVTAGNPTLLNTLFVPQYFHLHAAFPLDELRDRIDRYRAGQAYLGYMSQQITKWRAKSGVGRQELIDQFGFDTKYAYHAIRLGLQGHEFLTTGTITLPIPEPQRSQLAELRTGGFTEAAALKWANEVEAELSRVAADAPSEPRAPLAPLVTEFYRRWYGK